MQIMGTRLAGTGSTFELALGRSGRPGGAGGAWALQRAERRGGVRGGQSGWASTRRTYGDS